MFRTPENCLPNLPCVPRLAAPLLIFALGLVLPTTTNAWTHQEHRAADGTFIGYIIDLEEGDSLSGAWNHLVQLRSELDGGQYDVMNLPPGVTRIVDGIEPPINNWDVITIRQPLVIRGSREAPSTLDCTLQRPYMCIAYGADLILEDLELTSASQQEPFAMLFGWHSDVTLRRVRMESQDLRFIVGAVVVDHGILRVEDSIFVDNAIPEGDLFTLLVPDHGSEIRGSIFTGNTTYSLIEIGAASRGQHVLDVVQSTLTDNAISQYVVASLEGKVRFARSIVTDLAPHPDIEIVDSYTGGAPWLRWDGSGIPIPLPGSPVIDAATCPLPPGTDLLGAPRGLRASYLAPRGTDCDLGAVEAPHTFCMARDHSSNPEIQCDGDVPRLLSQLPNTCRIVGGLLDCTGGTETALTVLYPNDAAETRDAQLIMQADGNLVLYDRRDPSHVVPLWAPGTNVAEPPDPSEVDLLWNGGYNLYDCIGWVARFDQTFFWVLENDGGGEGGHCWAASLDRRSFIWADTAFLRDGIAGHRPQIFIEYFRDGNLAHKETADGAAAWVSPIEILPDSSFMLRGTILRPDNALRIPDAMAIHQQDGNFVLYEWQDDAWQPTWDTKTFGRCAGMNAAFRADGEMVIGKWEAGCDAHLGLPPGGVALRLWRDKADQARLSLYDDVGRILWQVPFPKGQATAERGSLMKPDEQLEIDGARFILQGDGNLVLYEWLSGAWLPTWASGTAGTCAGASAHFQASGKLVLGFPGSGCHWSPPVSTPDAVELLLDRDVNGAAQVSLVDADGNVLWQVP